MSRPIDPGRGLRRKVRQVRWKRIEIVQVILLALVLIGETICVALWLTQHSPD